MAHPYVGVTGVTTIQEVDDVIREFYNAGYNMDSFHLPMLGFLVSYKTLNGRETKNRRYPKFKNLRKLLFETRNNVFTVIHYNSREMNTLADQINTVFDGLYEDNLCNALQLNIVWPYIRQVELIKSKFQDMQIIFQLSKKILEGSSVEEIVSRLHDYKGLIGHVLIDPSGGRGLKFNLSDSEMLYDTIKKKLPDLVVGFAGGFNGDNVYKRLKSLADERIRRTDFSIDAEGGLRDKLSQEYGDDLLNIKKVRKYLGNTSRILI